MRWRKNRFTVESQLYGFGLRTKEEGLDGKGGTRDRVLYW